MQAPTTAEKPTTGKQRRAAAQAFHLLMDRQVTHVRVDQLDAVHLEIVGTAWDLHGPDGCCVCCHGGNPKRAHR